LIKKEIRPGVIQLTLDEERWYFINDVPFPSVTWILNYFPKGIGFDIYLAEKVHSWEQAKQVLREAGEQGARLHWGMEQYLSGNPLRIDDHPANSPYPFSAKEWQMILAGVSWVDKYKPTILSIEESVFGCDYAGTVDLVYKDFVTGEKKILDWKHGKYMYANQKAQQAAYVKAMRLNGIEVDGFDIIRLGSKHKVGYEWFESKEEDIKYYYHLFRCAMRFWKDENPKPAPKIIEVPEGLNLEVEPEPATDGEI